MRHASEPEVPLGVWGMTWALTLLSWPASATAPIVMVDMPMTRPKLVPMTSSGSTTRDSSKLTVNETHGVVVATRVNLAGRVGSVQVVQSRLRPGRLPTTRAMASAAPLLAAASGVHGAGQETAFWRAAREAKSTAPCACRRSLKPMPPSTTTAATPMSTSREAVIRIRAAPRSLSVPRLMGRERGRCRSRRRRLARAGTRRSTTASCLRWPS